MRMIFQWHEPFRLDTLDKEWEKKPDTPGIYVIQGDRVLNRLGGIDRSGILYIGKSQCLRDRLWTFWYAEHEASGLLYDNPRHAAIVFGARTITRKQIETCLGKLTARVATPIPERMLDLAERAVLYAYVVRFGELPPLNFALPQRWSSPPSVKWLRWGARGLVN